MTAPDAEQSTVELSINKGSLRLDAVQLDGAPVQRDTGGRSFDIVTVTDGKTRLRAGDEAAELGRYDTAIVSASAGAYEIQPVDGAAKVLRAALPRPPDTS